MKSLYRIFIAPLALLAYFLLALPFNQKAKSIFQLRKSSQKNRPDFLQGCYWVHASSGEFEYAKSVIREIKSADPSAKIVVTYSSPSYASAIAAYEGVDHSEPLPFDLQAPIKEFIRHFDPKVLMIARTDLWPEILWQCKAFSIPSILFSCSFPSKPAGLTKLWKSYLYSFIDYIYVITETDRTILTDHLGNHKSEIKSIGDTRVDQVVYRLSNAQIPVREDQRLCFLAGSTWKEDEDIIIPALSSLIHKDKLQLIIVPHEPTEKHIQQLIEKLKNHKLSYSLYSKDGYDFNAAVLIINKIGVLASLYPLADLSFVGGSFKNEVHSVMESLGAGCLTCVGPFYQNNREAVDFSKIEVNSHWNMVNIVQDVNGLRQLATDIQQNSYELDDVEALILAEAQSRQGASIKLVKDIERIQNV